MSDQNAIPPESKDWSIVTELGCTECGYSPHPRQDTASRLRGTALAWRAILENPNATKRTMPQRWSPLEYAAHVRDMCRLAGERVELMLTQNAPTFSNWDQDEQSVINDYFNAERLLIAADLDRELEFAARVFDGVPASSWDREGLRGDGKLFTVESFASFVLHEVEHHLLDANQGVLQAV
ncbi:DinB family protein [Paeniglutamicibacter sp. Y32M11]|uniref:DinB family protein n=1 Tax=Paeniglutamicibacter sp. Y32M11 TaxID=2853258 RepID=UPI001C52EABA|nr:DinB family protein [Paeniglutamicibacter sp. Y32M11]QXQ11659.1 DinB family protein [Paeniglutamicibacter sp. Y32M11]